MYVINLFGAPGAGKCFGKNTEVLMFDGSVKYIQDIKIGDLVMGDDSTPREVINLHRGTSKLYELKINKCDNLTVSENHILCLTDKKRGRDKLWYINDISIEDFVKQSKTYQQRAKLYQVAVSYPHKKLHIHPYYLGLWLGDGLSESLTRFCTADNEIVEWCQQLATTLGLELKKHSSKEGKCQTYCLSQGTCVSHYEHPIGKHDKIYHLTHNKHIPLDYLTASEAQRLELLAGLIDSDGYISKRNYIEITQKNSTLANDIVRLCCSLGMNAHQKLVYKKSQNMTKEQKGNPYHRITISGNLTKIPTKLPRKQIIKQQQRVNVLHHGFKIYEKGIGDYYGIETDGNQRFLLKNCMVVHNSTGSAYIFSRLKMEGYEVELITEFAKDKTWEGNMQALSNQTYVFGEQSMRMSRCKGKVDILITDSPLLLSALYNDDPVLGEKFNEVVADVFHSYANINFFVERYKPYNPVGRNQTEEQANQLSTELKQLCEKYTVEPIYTIPGIVTGYDWALEKIKEIINKK